VTTATSNRRQFSEDTRADLLVALVVIIALAIGWFYKESALSRMTPTTDPNSSFGVSLPSFWLTHELESVDTFLSAENPRADSVYKSTVTGQSFLLDPDNPTTPDTIVGRLVQRHGDELLGYHLLDIRDDTVGGAETRIVEYAYVVQPIDQPFRAAVPVVVHAFDYVIYTPTEYWILTFTADEQLMAKEQKSLEQIVASVKLP